jgi:cytosine/adenosine deaminase-related metal-dependent hydrolase
MSSSKTVIVHGVGISNEEEKEGRYSSFVLCPTTNQYLLNTVLNTSLNLEHGVWAPSILLGSDSRLTADGDLLDEMRFAKQYVIDEDEAFMAGISASSALTVVDMVTWYATPITGSKVGMLETNYLTDFILIKSDKSFPHAEDQLCTCHRSDLALVVANGIPQIGDPEIMAKFSHIETIPATLDGVPKAIQIDLARRISKCKLKEAGLELLTMPKKRFFIF